MQKRIKSRKLLYRRKLSKFHLRSIINSFSNFVSGVNDGVKVARNIQEENPRLCQIPNVKKAHFSLDSGNHPSFHRNTSDAQNQYEKRLEFPRRSCNM